MMNVSRTDTMNVSRTDTMNVSRTDTMNVSRTDTMNVSRTDTKTCCPMRGIHHLLYGTNRTSHGQNSGPLEKF